MQQHALNTFRTVCKAAVLMKLTFGSVSICINSCELVVLSFGFVGLRAPATAYDPECAHAQSQQYLNGRLGNGLNGEGVPRVRKKPG